MFLMNLVNWIIKLVKEKIMRYRKYLFGRLNTAGPYRTMDQKFTYIYDSMNMDVEIERYGYLWKFVDVQRYKDECIYGYLAKYDPDGEDEAIKGKSITRVIVDDKLNGKVFFLLHVPHGIIAYYPERGRVEESAFRKNFCECLLEAREHFFFQADIESITEREKILEGIKKFKRITSVVTEVFPTNPNNDPSYDSIDEGIKRMKASKVKTIYTGGGFTGLLVEEGSDVHKEIVMAVDGYGHAKAKGVTKDGKEKEISTSSTPISLKVSTDISHEAAIGSLEEKIGDLINGAVNE